MYNNMIEITTPDCGVLRSCETIHAKESTIWQTLFYKILLRHCYILNNFYSFSQTCNNLGNDPICTYNNIIEITNTDCGVLGLFETIDAKESTIWQTFFY